MLAASLLSSNRLISSNSSSISCCSLAAKDSRCAEIFFGTLSLGDLVTAPACRNFFWDHFLRYALGLVGIVGIIRDNVER